MQKMNDYIHCIYFTMHFLWLLSLMSIILSRISAAMTYGNEKQRLQQEVLDIKCLQLLRGMIHNQVVLLPEDWEGDLKTSKP